MKNYNFLLYLFALVFTLAFTSCSGDDSENLESAELLVGEWLLISQSTYFCGTDEFTGPSQCCLADLDDVFVYNQDGTWGSYNNGAYTEDATEYSQKGTWEYISGNSYEIYWASEDSTYTTTIIFEDNNTMKNDISDCWDSNGVSIYEYEVLTRQ